MFWPKISVQSPSTVSKLVCLRKYSGVATQNGHPTRCFDAARSHRGPNRHISVCSHQILDEGSRTCPALVLDHAIMRYSGAFDVGLVVRYEELAETRSAPMISPAY